MGGVWRWIFFSHGFQLAFTFKTVFKALDRDLHFVWCCMWGNTPTFCAHGSSGITFAYLSDYLCHFQFHFPVSYFFAAN